MLTSGYKELAARRIREFLWQECKKIWNNKLVSLSMRLLASGVVVMHKAGMTKRRTTEKVNVE